jgi:hypothetical protein
MKRIFTKEDMIDMARKSGFEELDTWLLKYPKSIDNWLGYMYNFANLVIKANEEKSK